MKTILKKILVLILFLMYFLPTVSIAAEIFFVSQNSRLAEDEDFLVEIFLDTEGVSANAVEGSVLFPPEFLELREIRDGNSIINFWVEKPHSLESGEIVFSGITPGGFYGPKSLLFGAVFRTKKTGDKALSFKDIQVLKNDGQGTKLPLSAPLFNFSISPELEKINPQNLAIEDNDPPEDFIPSIGSDPTVFDGKYFLVFSTTDKGVGIDHYEVREGMWGEYMVAESPYLLEDQSLKKSISVKAVDKQGNKRVAEIRGQNQAFKLEHLLIFGIILLICIFVFKKIWSKFYK